MINLDDIKSGPEIASDLEIKTATTRWSWDDSHELDLEPAVDNYNDVMSALRKGDVLYTALFQFDGMEDLVLEGVKPEGWGEPQQKLSDFLGSYQSAEDAFTHVPVTFGEGYVQRTDEEIAMFGDVVDYLREQEEAGRKK